MTDVFDNLFNELPDVAEQIDVERVGSLSLVRSFLAKV